MNTHPLLDLSDLDLGILAAALVPVHGGLHHSPAVDHSPLWWATAQALALRQWALVAVRWSSVPTATEIVDLRRTRDAATSSHVIPDELYTSVGSRARRWLLATLARPAVLHEADARVENLESRQRQAEQALESARAAVAFLEHVAEEAKGARDSAWFARYNKAHELGQPVEPQHPLPIPEGNPGCDVRGHLHRAVAGKLFDYPHDPLPEGY